ncbi:MAG: STAS domain-containing protein [Atopobiaceae bacterium]|nr:STAS domain-containing protein [Atopobiaceae bacterium]
MPITTTTNGTKACIAVSGWLDTSAAPQLEQAIAELDPSCTELVIDLAELEYISSSGLRQLVIAHRNMNGHLTVANVPSDIMAVLAMAGFDKRLNIA